MLQDLFGQLADDASQTINDALQSTPLDGLNDTLQNAQESSGDVATTATDKLKEFTPDNVDGLIDGIAEQLNGKK